MKRYYFALIVPRRAPPKFLWAASWDEVEQEAADLFLDHPRLIRRLIVGRTARPLALLSRYAEELRIDARDLSVRRIWARLSGGPLDYLEPGRGGRVPAHHSLESRDRDFTVFG